MFEMSLSLSLKIAYVWSISLCKNVTCVGDVKNPNIDPVRSMCHQTCHVCFLSNLNLKIETVNSVNIQKSAMFPQTVPWWKLTICASQCCVDAPMCLKQYRQYPHVVEATESLLVSMSAWPVSLSQATDPQVVCAPRDVQPTTGANTKIKRREWSSLKKKT